MSTLKVTNLQHASSGSASITLDSAGTASFNSKDVSGIASINGGQIGVANLVQNGAMTVAQRATSVTSVSTEGYKTVDRFKWTMDTTSSVYTLTQSTDVPSGQGFANSFKAETTTADASLDANCQVRFEHRFEGQDLQQLAKGTSNAKSVTLSFWVKAFQTGTYVINLQDTDNSRLIAATYTVDTSATWEYKTVTFTGDTTGAFTNDNNLSLVIHWYLSAGSTYTSGTLATSWESLTNANRAVGQTVDIADSTSNYWAITGVQLEVGSQATPFEHRPYGDELARCQRYYWRQERTSGTNGYVGTASGWSTTEIFTIVRHPTTMRASPSLSYSASNALTGATNLDSRLGSAITSGQPGTDNILIYIDVSGATEGKAYTMYLNNDGNWIACDAEL